MKRRDFLRTLLAVTVATSVITCNRNPKSIGDSSESADETILVIGAGFSGLGAARALTEAGYTVVVLEGRDRLGGRTFTSEQWDDAPVDLGASWIHGVDGNPLTALADEVGAERVVTEYESYRLYDTEGEEASDRLETSLEDLETTLTDRLLDQLDSLDPDLSLEEAVAEVMDWPNLSATQRQQLEFIMNTVYEQEWGGDASELSVAVVADDSGFDGDDVLFLEGYKVLVDYLAKDLDVRLEHQVEKIQYDSDGVTVITDQGEFTGDRVIVTVPLGVLQAGTIEFVPPLPSEKQEAIEALGMGVLNKLYLRFSEAFWPDDADWLEYLSAEKGHWTEWVNLHRHTEIPILLGFNAATFGWEVEKWSDEEIVEDAMTTLRRIFGNDIPEPEDWQITRWGSDPFSYGSYSFDQAGSDSETRETLAEPVDDRVFFAGEATSTDNPSTVHGAYLSGLEVAEAIGELDARKPGRIKTAA
jgi:monoamine oxidase